MNGDGFVGLFLLVWISIAILSGGLAQSRGRSGWRWFLATLLAGPLACAVLVVWPMVPSRNARGR
ncbi:hypothetical protein BF93_18125 [Brachybacterium phenoliresistens]|uniref:Uncharacterized protein n=1 Tax=Brachybacterium phenoliresistens TaxID=396014 RepID=Z9JTH2_9MICO|nr:hypothetical protein BF93_18125 [Brachybacterium phenoliresistens]